MKVSANDVFLLFFAGVFLLHAECSCLGKKQAPERAVAALLVQQTGLFDSVCKKLGTAAGETNADPGRLRALFLRARLAYKTIEWAVEYFEPATARSLNGPPVEEAELSGQVFPPAGLQVIEAMLWPAYDSAQKIQLIRQTAILSGGAGKCKNHFSHIGLFDWQIFDAGKLEVFRVETLGISGFDNPLTLGSAAESAAAIRALQPVFRCFSEKKESEDLFLRLDSAVQYLDRNRDFNRFDRAVFIRRYANPLSAVFGRLQNALGIQVTRYNRLLNQDASTLFDTAAFNRNAYVPDMAGFATPEKIELGKKLFSEPLLSGTGKRSCQSCHQPAKAFTDGVQKNTVLENGRPLARNTPTLLNAALQPALFADLRVKTLEDQSVAVVENAAEMHGSMKTSVKTLWQDTTYRNLFARAFPGKPRQGIDTSEVMNAIGSYVRSLTHLDSRFDAFMRGQDAALTVTEIHGFNLFMGKAKCGTCHYMPLFSGVFPPRYVKMESEVIGTPAKKQGQQIDPDSGRYVVSPLASWLHSFKTPTLRNIEITAPYMHNGVYENLDEVVDFYNRGGGKGAGMKLENQTLPFDSLQLTRAEQSAIVAFMKSLTGRQDPVSVNR